MLDGAVTRDCSILYNLAFRLGFGAIIGAWRVVLFRRWGGFAGSVLQREEKNGLA
jgi:hypothetical protein